MDGLQNELNVELRRAARSGDLESVRKLLLAGANPKDAGGAAKCTALGFAAASDRPGCLRLLLPVSDLLHRDLRGLGALDEAAYSGPGCVMDLLAALEERAGAEETEAMARKALEWASKHEGKGVPILSAWLESRVLAQGAGAGIGKPKGASAL